MSFPKAKLTLKEDILLLNMVDKLLVYKLGIYWVGL